MVPQTSDAIIAAAKLKLADVERRLAADARAVADERWRDGAARLAALRRAADELRAQFERSDDPR